MFFTDFYTKLYFKQFVFTTTLKMNNEKFSFKGINILYLNTYRNIYIFFLQSSWKS